MGSKEKKRAYFNSLEQDTLARLIKERPRAEQELAESVGYLVAEEKVLKVPHDWSRGWCRRGGYECNPVRSNKRTRISYLDAVLALLCRGLPGACYSDAITQPVMAFRWVPPASSM